MTISTLNALGIVAAAFVGGCANPSHLVFHQSSSLGVDVAANADTGHIHMALGYDRQTDTLIPKTTIITDANREENEAMSVISTSKIRVKGMRLNDVNEQFATGQAAVNIAAKPRSAAQVSTLSETKTQFPR